MNIKEIKRAQKAVNRQHNDFIVIAVRKGTYSKNEMVALSENGKVQWYVV
jgi:hypothetical protein